MKLGAALMGLAASVAFSSLRSSSCFSDSPNAALEAGTPQAPQPDRMQDIH